MLFNSVEFLIFFPVVTILYFLLPQRWRWLHLLIASCVFYMSFIPVYILILFFTIVIDYIAGILIENAEGRKRKLFLLLSIVANVGVLAVFKYYNFFTDNVNFLLHDIGINSPSVPYLNIVLPIGLSFHTFQAMSYTIEVYFGRQPAERHFGIYSLYVMFYPQLVAGPIERPQNLLHQFREKYSIDYNRMRTAFFLMAWGFFQKVVIADRLSLYVDPVFNHPGDFNGLNICIATLFFCFQIYCDFSAYTDIARGAAHMMGFNLIKNFNQPYHAVTVTEFWSRWHMSLSTWFKDYLYIPLGGNRGTAFRTYRNLAIVFIVSGLWHGASWAFVVWGALHGVYVIAERIFAKQYQLVPAAAKRLITFGLVWFAWIFFRATSLTDATLLISRAFNFTAENSFKLGFFKFKTYDISKENIVLSFLMIMVLLGINTIQYRYKNLSEKIFSLPFYARWSIYYMLLFMILQYGVFTKNSFIYFQF
jgi:alginate O-acetyltransferase complex protein AlgI